MSTEKSERILAALSRAKATRLPNTPATLERSPEPETPQSALPDSIEEENESVTPEIASDSGATSPEESVEAESPVFDEPAEAETSEVETSLPVIAASDQQRVAPPAAARTSIVARTSTVKPEAQPAPSAIKREEQPTRSGDTTRVAEPPTRASAAERGVKAEQDLFEPIAAPRKFPIKLVIAGGAVVAVGLALFLLRDHLWTSKPSAGSGRAASLQMQVESQGSGIINIRWNPQSEVVAQAREGRLVILEHDQQPRTVPLGAEQLKIGHLFYQSPVDSVEFRLEIVSPSGSVTQESVLALASAKAAEPAAGPPIAPSTSKANPEPSATAPKAANPEVKAEPKVEAKAETKTETAVVKKPAEVAPARPLATRSFTPPPSERKTGEPGALIVDPPPAVPSAPAALPAVSIPEATARVAPPALAPPAPPPLKSGGNLQAPKLIKRVTPDYPSAARAANIQGVVKFTATIAKDGSIHNVQAVSGPAVLIPAATEAVKKWVYQPMLLDGQPVEVVTQIEVNFALHQ